MVKIFKYVTALVAILTGSIGLYFYFSFKNIHFDIKNDLNIPIKAYLTIYSKATKKDYTYPILAKESIPPKTTAETFYTMDKAADGTECLKIIFKNEKSEVVKSFPCPNEGDTITLK